MNSRLYVGHSIQSNSSTVAYGASLFDGKLVRILIEKLSDVVDLAERFFRLGLVESHREPSEPVPSATAADDRDGLMIRMGPSTWATMPSFAEGYAPDRRRKTLGVSPDPGGSFARP